MTDNDQPILLEKRAGIGYITFNRPEVLNAFRPSDYILFNDLVNDCDQDDDLPQTTCWCAGGRQESPGRGSLGVLVAFHQLERSGLRWLGIRLSGAEWGWVCVHATPSSAG